MRIVGGKWRGRNLQMPPFAITRPTTDRVREALMDSLTSRFDFEGAQVLDAFAGSGALGLEALSRGAAKAVFYERNERAFRVLQRNVQSLEAQTHVRLVRRDVLVNPPIKESEGFNLVLLDPPYATDPSKVAALLAKLDEMGKLAVGAFVYYEHLKSLDLSASVPLQALELRSIVYKSYGDIAFDLLRKENR